MSGSEKTAEELGLSLKNRLWDAVDEIGHGGYSDTRIFTDDMWAAYARGVKATLDVLAENWLIDLPTHQIYGALGERLRRKGSSKQHGGFRAVNNILDRIRDHRIAILDQYVSLDRNIEHDCERKLRAFNKRFDPGADRELESAQWLANETVQNELRALRELYMHLLSDRGWFAKHWPKKPMEAAA